MPTCDSALMRGELAGRPDAASAGDAPSRLVLRPLAPGDEAELLRIHRTPEVMRWWDVPSDDFPWDEPDAERLTMELDGAIVGLIQFWEETEPKYRHASIDVFVDPAAHGRGIGTE